METKNADPYRTGVRVVIDEPAEPLPDFLTKRLDDLVAARKRVWERNRVPPNWWMRHVDRHVRDFDPEKRSADPCPTFFVASAAWNLSLWLLHLGIRSHVSGGPLLGAAAYAHLWCGGIILAATLGLARFNGLWWAIKHVGLPPVSLWLTFKEVVAWALFYHGGKRWRDPVKHPWDEDRAAHHISEDFLETHFSWQRNVLRRLKDEEVPYRCEIASTQERIKRYAEERARLAPEMAHLGDQLTRSILLEERRVEMLTVRADRLSDSAKALEECLETVQRHVRTYETLQDSRQRLRRAGALADDDTNDLLQLDLLRRAYLDLRRAAREAEAVLLTTDARVAPDEQAALALAAGTTARRAHP